MLSLRSLRVAQRALRKPSQLALVHHSALTRESATPRRRSAARVTALSLLAAAGGAAAAFSTATETECKAAAPAKKDTAAEKPVYLAKAEDFLYPPIQPFNKGMLKVSDTHTIYYEECGNPNGKPVIMVHGGPGGGCSESMRRFHDPRVYRIVLFDQRGCGRSLPHACLEENTYVTF
jgi:proline iminopeptidase